VKNPKNVKNRAFFGMVGTGFFKLEPFKLEPFKFEPLNLEPFKFEPFELEMSIAWTYGATHNCAMRKSWDKRSQGLGSWTKSPIRLVVVFRGGGSVPVPGGVGSGSTYASVLPDLRSKILRIGQLVRREIPERPPPLRALTRGVSVVHVRCGLLNF
jgi:hypothetical protein